MFVAAITTLLDSFSRIFRKKSLNFWVSERVHALLSYPIGIMLVVLMFFIGFDIARIDLFIIAWILVTILLDLSNMKRVQKLYTEEKYSVIAPYTNLNKILIIIGSFFIFKDVSIIALGITLVAICVIIWFSIDFKTLKLPKQIKNIVIAECITAVTVLIVGWLIANYSEKIYFVIYTVLAAAIYTGMVLYLGQQKQLKSLPKKFWIYRYIGGLWFISWFLWLTLIKNLWLSVSILLSFLGLAAALVFSYIFMKDIPSKKDMLLTLIVTILVWLWFYYK